jgi:hypothetical protein
MGMRNHAIDEGFSLAEGRSANLPRRAFRVSFSDQLRHKPNLSSGAE